MRKRTSKALGLRQANFELKRMEVLRYHYASDSFCSGSSTDPWIWAALLLTLLPMSIAKEPENKNKDKKKE